MRSSSAWLAVAALLALAVPSFAAPRPRYVSPNKIGVYGFGELATGGDGFETVVVDTAVWREPEATVDCTETGADDAGFCPDHCGTSDTGDNDTCSFSEAVCEGNRTVTFSISGAIPIPEACVSHSGMAGCTFELKDCPTANIPIKNLTVDGSTAPGAGVYLEGNDFTVSGVFGSSGNPGVSAENIVLRHLRHSGSSTVDNLAAGISVTGCVNCAFDHLSVRYPQTYLMGINSVFYGFYGERNRGISLGYSLLAFSHVLGEQQGASQVDEFAGGYGFCSIATTRKCCMDGDNTGTLFDGECPGTETCNDDPAQGGTQPDADCRIEQATGKVFSILGRSVSDNVGAVCSTDYDAIYGQCRAFCEGTGTDANKVAGHGPGEVKRKYYPTRGINDTTGAECSTCGVGSCRCECPQATNYARGPFLGSGQDNYGTFVSANISDFSMYRNLIMGVKWRQPNLGPDTNSGNTSPTPVDEATQPGRYDVVQNVAFGGKYMSDIWTEYSQRDVSQVYSRNYHYMNTALDNLYADTIGTLWSGGNHGSFVAAVQSADNTGPNVKLYFDNNLDRFHSVGAETCVAGSGCSSTQSYSFSCGATQDPAGITPPCTGIAGQDGYWEHGYFGKRDPHKNYPAFPGTFAALKTLVADEAGATLPCRDAVDEYFGAMVKAGIARRVFHHRDELGGVQQDMSVCPSAVEPAFLTAQSKIGAAAVDVSVGSGIGSTTVTVTSSESRLLKMHCGIDTPGSVMGRVRDPRCNAGTLTIDWDAGAGGSSLAAGCYAIPYWATIGQVVGGVIQYATGTVEVDVGGTSCESAPPVAGSCLATSTSTTTASSGTDTYNYSVANRGVDATGVTWTPAYSSSLNMVETSGSAANQCFSGGFMDGPFEPDADVYYELATEHGCTQGSCSPGQCDVASVCRPGYAYHTTAGFAPDSTNTLTGDWMKITDIGDGVGRRTGSGTAPLFIRDSYFADIHDDGVEDDWLRPATIENNLTERVFNWLAWHKRSGGPSDCASGTQLYVNNNLVELKRFTHAYQEKVGHGGFWKIDNDGDDLCRWNIKGNLFLAGPVAGDQFVVPPIERITSCGDGTAAGANKILWTGTQAAWDSWMADRDTAPDNGPYFLPGATGTYADNGARVAFLESLPNCLSHVVKPVPDTVAQFLIDEGWKAARDAWCAAHAGLCEAYAY